MTLRAVAIFALLAALAGAGLTACTNNNSVPGKSLSVPTASV